MQCECHQLGFEKLIYMQNLKNCGKFLPILLVIKGRIVKIFYNNNPHILMFFYFFFESKVSSLGRDTPRNLAA